MRNKTRVVVDDVRHHLESHIRAGDTESSRQQQLVFDFSDDDMQRQYRVFCQADTNVPLTALVYIMYLVLFVTRCVDRFWALNWATVAAFAVGTISCILAGNSLLVRAAMWDPVAKYPLQWETAVKCRNFLQTLHESPFYWSLLNDTLMVLLPATIGMTLLSKALLAPCPDGVSMWDSQFCHTAGETGVAGEYIASGVLSIFVLQILGRGARLEAVFVAWLVLIGLVNAAMYVVGSPLYLWVDLPFVVGMACSYEVERHNRKVFLNQRDALLSSAANAKLQVEIATRDLVAKRAMVRHISHEIRTPLNITAVGMDTLARTLQKMQPTKYTAFMNDTVTSCKIACEDALTIVTELLDFEKLAAGLCTLETTPTRLVPWVEDTVKPFRVSADFKRIKVGFTTYSPSSLSLISPPHPSPSPVSLTLTPHPSPLTPHPSPLTPISRSSSSTLLSVAPPSNG